MSNTAPIEVRLEAAFVALLEAIADPTPGALATLLAPFASSGDSPLAGVAIEQGHQSDVQSNAERIVVDCQPPGGRFIKQGNYQVPASFIVITAGVAVEGETESPIVRHGKRIEKIAAVMQNKPVIKAALTLIDPGIAVASYYPQAPSSGRRGVNFIAERGYLCSLNFTGV